MKKFTFDFNLEAWVAGVEIEANSYDEALEKLNGMTAEELLEEGYIKQSEISTIDCSVEDEEDEFDDDDDSFYTDDGDE